MKLVRYIYPIEGRVIVKEEKITELRDRITKTNDRSGRIEIFNIHGDLVRIIRELKKIKMLNLQHGFYLIREKDINGRVIKSRKVIV